MLFSPNKRFLLSSLRNGSVRFLQSDTLPSDKPLKNNNGPVYEYVKLKYDQKLQVLEEKLELAEETRAKAHETILEKANTKLKKLKNCICNKNSDLLMAGSVATGLTTSTDSDVDTVFVVLDDKSNNFACDFNDNIKFRNDFMKLVGQLIRANKKLWDNKRNKMHILYDAKVPIIKLEFEDGIKMDIQFCNHHTLKNTNLLRYYAASDSRFRKLYIYVKSLISNLDLLNGEKGLLTSYQISVLVAHFLQKPLNNQPPVLPIIPKVCSTYVSPNLSIEEVIENLNKPIDVTPIQLKINPKPLASHLAIQFIDYFSDFDFLNDAIFMDKINPVEIFQVDLLPKLQLFDLYSDKSISHGDRALEAFSTNMKYVQNLLKEGYFINSFPSFNEEKYLKENNKENITL